MGGTGTISLNGKTKIAPHKTFTVGTAGLGGNIEMYGNVLIGGSATHESVSTTLYGDFSQHDDFDGSIVNTFSTATGAISLNGDIAVATGKDLLMSDTGDGSFRSGTGSVILNGDVQISGDKAFTSGTGAVQLNGAVALGDAVPLSLGSPGTGGVAQLFGNVIIGSSPHSGSRKLDVYGDVTFHNDGDGTTKSFTSATGPITFNGDVTVSANKFLHMANTGTGTFQT